MTFMQRSSRYSAAEHFSASESKNTIIIICYVSKGYIQNRALINFTLYILSCLKSANTDVLFPQSILQTTI
jgi:hypothetical protein